jgi:translation elongation factor EF-1beta
MSVETPFLLVVNCDGDESEKAVHEQLKSLVKRYNVKQKSVRAGNTELTLEVRMKDREGAFINRIQELSGVKNAVLISYSGDYVS